MKRISKLILSFATILISTLSFNVFAQIKEDTSLFTDDVYVIGSTKFDSDFIITASRAAIAGADEAFIQMNVYNNYNFRGNAIKTYYYCALDNSWSEVTENGSGLKSLSEDEVNNLKDNLNIFFVNNVEKTLEIPFDGVVDEGSLSGATEGTGLFSNNTIKVPASWINGFSFTSNGAFVEVSIGSADEKGNVIENTTPVIKKSASIEVNFPEIIYATEKFEFTVTMNGNDDEGKVVGSGDASFNYSGMITGVTMPSFDAIEYYDESTATWKTGDLLTPFGDNITTKTVKFRTALNYEGNYNLYIYRGYDNNYSVNFNKTINVVINPAAVAFANNMYYDNLKTAIESASDNSTVKLVKDTDLSEIIRVYNTITLDLNNHNLQMQKNENGKDDKEIYGVKIRAMKTSNLTVTNGNIIGLSYALQAEDDATLNVLNDVNINFTDENFARDRYGITIFDNAKVYFNGNINVISANNGKESYGISGNNLYGGSNEVHITGGKINVLGGVAVYQPQIGSLFIDDGELTANTVIGVKSGNINIEGGILKAVGVANTPQLKTDGTNSTGDVIYIEENPAYDDSIIINISDNATLSSENGYIIRELNPTIGTSKELKAIINGKYNTKHLTSDDQISYYDDEEATLIADGINYSSSDFSKLAKTAKELVLEKDLSVNGLQALFVNVLDLNGNTLTLVGESELGVVNKSDVTIKNGNIVTGGLGIQVQDTSILTIDEDVNMTVNDGNLKSSYGIALYDEATLNFAGNLTVLGDAFGISGNGSEEETTTLNITGGSISALNGYAIYQPQKSTTTISGGELTGNGVIAIKSGNLSISGGTLTATGDKNIPEANTGTVSNTGSVIFIEENPAYHDNIQIEITGGVLSSTNDNPIILELNPTIGTSKELNSVITGNYTVKNSVTGYDNLFYYTSE